MAEFSKTEAATASPSLHFRLSIDQREQRVLEIALTGDTLPVLPDSLEAQGNSLPERVPSIYWTTTGNGWVCG